MAALIDVILHLDAHLSEWISFMGPWIYLLLFLIVFCETGLIFMPFLPGDSLLFAIGALCVGSPVLHWPAVSAVLLLAAFLGDNTNYRVGQYLGKEWALKKGLIKAHHLEKTEAFYKKYGPLAVIIARFVPIVRTVAPFVAGIGAMKFNKFISFSFVGSLLWVGIFIPAGYFFGNLPSVKSNFHYVIFGVIGLSVLPIVVSAMKAHLGSKKAKA